MGVFDAAIRQLRFGIPKSMGYSEDEVANFKAAIRVLEAAGRLLEFRQRYARGEKVWAEYMDAIQGLTDSAFAAMPEGGKG